jgi:hypothetical protein
MTTTKCVCAVMLIEKEGVLTQVLAQQASQERASAESSAGSELPQRLERDRTTRALALRGVGIGAVIAEQQVHRLLGDAID